MADYTLYDATVPLLKDILSGLEGILKKGEQTPNAASLPEARIFDDMKPLNFQVIFVTDLCLKWVARATGVDPPTVDRDVNTFAGFYKLIEQARESLDKADKDTINKRVNETVIIGLGPGKDGKMLLRNYWSGYVAPNVFFHVTTAYNIMRKEGIPLGKMDYLSYFIEKHTEIITS
ncbi:hypothetical protein AAL_06118 [Moelleriella libera RCEF 2490]|uniref:DUF1993 domain-containing protein n=1 Tax=Moelleriella libera RCEF 2490 TaxID=1081109 RepID=A0A167ZCX1_9HYPO|nr:hypothetical protein AAL_06118 [Moelleriella libera RCEF 2490]